MCPIGSLESRPIAGSAEPVKGRDESRPYGRSTAGLWATAMV
jgi:hypothetical protein